ncbi:hypothetical protein PS843_04269 [Pseudomonas fluorescens]|nr:hypothetical protein PS843_04269 [Pseudomonas fluorescens]
MRSMDPYKIWLFPHRNSPLRNTLPHHISILGGGQ